MVSCAKNGRTDLNDYCVRRMTCFLHKEFPFGRRDDCTCIKIFSGVNFLITINSLTH